MYHIRGLIKLTPKGSVILFDLLCRQTDRKGMGLKSTGGSSLVFDFLYELPVPSSEAADNVFRVENLFCLGSPIGLFQMLKGRTIAGFSFCEGSHSPLAYSSEEESARQHHKVFNSSPLQVSSPSCRQIFNIFHPTDPIAYRIEPLVSPAMAELKPQPLPYTKRGIWTGTAQLAGGISGIGQSVTKSVSGLWSSLSSGIASSILNRSLGFPDTKGEVGERELEKMREQRKGTTVGNDESNIGQPARTLIDDEIETLYEGFQKRRKSAALVRPSEKTNMDKGNANKAAKSTGSSAEGLSDDELDIKANRLKHEEAKVRALNATGRIDFAIQEGVFDLSLISSLASHLGYWNDEDVAHFMISQLLSRRGLRTNRARNEGASEGRSSRPRDRADLESPLELGKNKGTADEKIATHSAIVSESPPKISVPPPLAAKEKEPKGTMGWGADGEKKKDSGG